MLANEIRKEVVTMCARAKSSHVGTGLSMVDILTWLYSNVMNVSNENVNSPLRDIFILSKGHGSAALYATLAYHGFFDRIRLEEYYQDDGHMPGHPVRNVVPGVEASTGSLGHGLAIGMGHALGQKLSGMASKTYVLLGDGECNEGSIWEAAMLAPKLKLENLIVIIDHNKLQGFGYGAEINAIEPLTDKWKAFGWNVGECNGHQYDELQSTNETLLKQSTTNHLPSIIIAHTIKGKGVSFMENRLEWHYKSPNDQELVLALEELSQ